MPEVPLSSIVNNVSNNPFVVVSGAPFMSAATRLFRYDTASFVASISFGILPV